MRMREWFGRRSATEDVTRLTIAPESYAGRMGVTLYENGRRVAWAPTEDAVLATYQVGRAA